MPISRAEGALIEPGCYVADLAVDAPLDIEPEAVRDGIVYAISPERLDAGTGEIAPARLYACTPWRGRVRWVELAVTEVEQWRPANTATIRSLIRRLTAEVGRARLMGDYERQCLDVSVTLSKLL